MAQRPGWALALAAIIAGAATSVATSTAKLDRPAIVARHNPALHTINTSEVAVLGNGAFAAALTVDRRPGFEPGQPLPLRLLVRTSGRGTGMAEFYVGGVMSHPYTFAGPGAAPLGSIGQLVIGSGAAVSGAAAFRMTLPAE